MKKVIIISILGIIGVTIGVCLLFSSLFSSSLEKKEEPAQKPIVEQSVEKETGPTPYVLWYGNQSTLVFMASNDDYKKGDCYGGQSITDLWKGDDVTKLNICDYGYGYCDSPEWSIAVRDSLQKVVFEKSFSHVRPTSLRKWFSMCSNLSTIEGMENLNTSEVTDMSEMFCGCSALSGLDVSHFNTSKVTDMAYLFCRCERLTSLDVSHFDTSTVTNMMNMFSGCRNLGSLDVSNFDTGNVTNMGYMFEECGQLTNIDVSHFDTSKVIDLWFMFSGCRNLSSLDVSHFDTKNVNTIAGMFKDCAKLENIDVSRFNTENVLFMQRMFSGCSSLKSLDLTNFVTDNLQPDGCSCEMDACFEGMFFGCCSLKVIYCNDTWEDNTGIDCKISLFGGCVNLVGGQGMRYNPKKVDIAYANPGKNGYFTLKNN